MDTNYKPLINVLLEAIAKRNHIDLNLKNAHLKNLGKLNILSLWEMIQSVTFLDVHGKDLHDVLLLNNLAAHVSNYLKISTAPNIYFPNMRPVNHFTQGEEVYVMVSDFSSAKQGDYKELGFIKTIVEFKEANSPFLKLKTFDDLPDGHHPSVGNSSGHAATNFGRLLKVSEFEALQELVATNPEYVDLFRTNSVGQFQNLELYDVNKYKKVDIPPTFDLGTALIPKSLYAGNFKDT